MASSRTRTGIGLALKLAVMIGCFWYISRYVVVSDLLRLASSADLRWLGLSVLIIMVQIPLLGLRWATIVDSLSIDGKRTSRRSLLAVTAIGAFFGQIAPSVVGDSIRILMLKQLGRSWRECIISVVIDRGVGLGMLIMLAFCVFLFPSNWIVLGNHRGAILTVFGAALATGLLAILLAPIYAPIFARWSLTHWVSVLALESRKVLFGRRSGPFVIAIQIVIHSLTVITIWVLGYAEGFMFSAMDAVLLFTIMVGIAVIPITVGGWGIRELAVMILFQGNGIAPERALLFSASFGVIVFLGSSVGAVVWLLYSPKLSDRSTLSHNE